MRVDGAHGPHHVVAHPLPHGFRVEEEPVAAVSGFRHVEMLPNQWFDPVEKDPLEKAGQQRQLQWEAVQMT